jgi:carboxymethylenebutenolidase
MGEFETIEARGGSARLYVTGSGPTGVVVLHPWWGLNDDVTAYADRLAAAGFAVVAPDLFDGQVATTVDDAKRLATSADEDALNDLVLATVDRFADRLGSDAGLGLVGFSFGAHWAMWTAAERDRVAASVVYYGTTDGPYLASARVPVLGHFAEADQFEADEDVAAFEDTLASAGREVTIHRYPGTGHWFAEPSRDAYRPEAAELAFERTVAFLEQELTRTRA